MVNPRNDARIILTMFLIPASAYKAYIRQDNDQMRRILLSFSIILMACTSGGKLTTIGNNYQHEISEWVMKREAALKAPNGWLNLVGLHWLAAGDNTFGSGAGNKIIFPQGKIADHAGIFRREGNTIALIPAADADIRNTATGKPFTGGIIFHPDSTAATELSAGDLRWTVIRRGELLGIRLRDNHAPALESFHGISRFPVSTDWLTEATLVKNASANADGTITIGNVLGQETAERSGGVFQFRIKGKSYRLEAIDDGGKELFIVFGDQTNGDNTYGGGRFLYIPRPDADGKTIIDFNKAINPPCVFTAFATCPLPPRQNRLQLKIEAGEKVEGVY